MRDNKRWHTTITTVLILEFFVIIIWATYEKSLEPLVSLLGTLPGMFTYLGLQKADRQEILDKIITILLLILIPLVIIGIIAFRNQATENKSAEVAVAVSPLQTIQFEQAALISTLISLQGSQSIASDEHQSDLQVGPTVSAIANRLIELDATKETIPTPTFSFDLTRAVSTINSTVEAISLNKVQLTNPSTGQLVHDRDGLLEDKFSPVSVRDFIAYANFVNPYGVEENSFDFGFLFRVGFVEGSDNCNCYRLQIDSSGVWTLVLVNPDSPNQFQQINGGTTNFVNTESTGQNELRLIAKDEDGYFYLNGNFIAKLNLSQRTNPGGVSVAIGMRYGNEVPGEITHYEDFTIWELSE